MSHPITSRPGRSSSSDARPTTASYNAILTAATPGESDKPAKTTTIAYRDVLQSLWLLDEVDAWLPTRNDFVRLGQAPKHQLADPALAARLLGALFEHLVTLSVRVYVGAADASVHHLRTSNGDHEVDLIVQRPDGRVLAIEVKLADRVTDDDVRHLTWLRSQIGDELVDAVVVTTVRHAYRRSDGIAVVPAALLGP